MSKPGSIVSPAILAKPSCSWARVSASAQAWRRPIIRECGKEKSVSTVKVKWQISDEEQRKRFIDTGERPDQDYEFSIDLVDQIPLVRKALIEENARYGGPINMTGLRMFSPGKNMHNNNYLEYRNTNLYFKDQPTIEEILSYIDAQNAERAKASAHIAKLKAEEKAKTDALRREYDKRLPVIQVLIEARDYEALGKVETGPAYLFKARDITSLSKLVSDARSDIRKERAFNEKDTWIKDHGSDHLKRAWARDHSCQRLYAIERGANEAPKFTVDVSDMSNWKDRSTPSVVALNLADEMDARGLGDETKIVWLTSLPQDRIPSDDEYLLSEDYHRLPAEAVVIRGYLGKYDLVHII